ncbi:calcium-binding protein [Actinoplanes sp. LDG1-06]|uniref:Calcium-binding protein n=1 Tax=Paractinoplanes ovalisporus TaxID=2810368 RepID=A0ABS2ACZ9_9ACTN|nr:calcium-binding protein [Actinoplanes ovalisporus]MBM2617134.1 calcium-binding protein [Actinoplanes ovalisporus]
MKRTVRIGTGVLGAAAVAGVAWIALPAEAAATGVVSVVSSNIVVYTAASGKANTVVLTRSGNAVTVDDVYGIKAGTGCSAVSGDVTRIRCALPVAPIWVRVDLGDGNDTLINNSGLGMTAWGRAGSDKITGGPLKDDVYGGEGNDGIWGLGGNDVLRGEGGDDAVSGGDGADVLSGSTGNDRLYGGEGNDRAIYGGPGNDRLEGGPGDDFLRGDAGNDIELGGPGTNFFYQDVEYPRGTDADSFAGGDGDDIVLYWQRTNAVTADPDAVKGDDGAVGEGDTIGTSIEQIWGGSGNDRLVGSARGNETLDGGAGKDTLLAGGGDDAVWAGSGIDYVDAGDGRDYCADDVEPGETVINCEYGNGAPALERASLRREAGLIKTEAVAIR